MDKTILVRDKLTINDKPSVGFRKTVVTFYVEGSDEILWQGSNRSVLTGSPFTAYDLFDISEPEFDVRENIPCYDYFKTKEGLDENTTKDTFVLDITEGESDINDAKCYLWCVGKGGTVSAPSQLIANDFASWIYPDDLIPFRVVASGNEVSDEFKKKYFGRRIFDDKKTPYTAYYFKKITGVEFNIRRNGDGNKLTGSGTIKKNLEDIYRSKRNLSIDNTDNLGYRYYESHEIESYIEIKLQLTTDELREWFMINDNELVNPEKTPLNNAHIDTLSLCMATPVYKDGEVVDYKNITPLTKLNFYEEKLGDLDKGIDILYQLYF